MPFTKPIELERKRIQNALAQILQKPLVIITAPSGFGKTTAVKSFFKSNSNLKVGWVVLTRTGGDENWIWKKLCNAIDEISPRVGSILLEMGLPQDPKEEEKCISIIRENIKGDVCIVFDDFHEYVGSVLSRLIERITYEEIAGLHILILTRIYPNIACEELFLRGYCEIIDQRMMSLSKEESEEVFRINGFCLNEDELNRMYEYTDGWIAAVYLALYDYKKEGNMEYLTNIGRLLKSAIYEKLSPAMQELCMKMSLVENFSYEEASHVLEKTVSPYELKRMEEEYGFIHFDSVQKKYRMHSMLRNVAAGELEKHCDRKEVYRKCGEYREKTGALIPAIVCYRNSGNFDLILKILSQNEVRDQLFDEAPSIIEGIFDMLPIETKLSYPGAYLGFIYQLIIKDKLDKGRILYNEIMEKLQTMEEGMILTDRLRGELKIIDALLQFNNLTEINKRWKEAEELLEHQPSAIFARTLLTFGTPSIIALYYKKTGELRETAEQGMEYARHHFRLIRGIDDNWDDLFEAEYHLLKYDLDVTMNIAGSLIRKARSFGDICIVISGVYVKLRCLIQLGRTEEAYQLLTDLENYMKDKVRAILITDYELAIGYVYACIGHLNKIPEWLVNFKLESCSRFVRNVRSGCVVYGMMLCRKSEWEELNEIANQILVPYETTRHIYIIIYGYIFKAIAMMHQKGLEEGCQQLLEAVKCAEADELKLPFIEVGRELMPMLEILEKKSAFCKDIIEKIKDAAPNLKKFEERNTEILLTNRERELMCYVKQGLKNGEISELMHIALVTVEKNLTSIYRKLNVSNRASAIAKLERIGL